MIGFTTYRLPADLNWGSLNGLDLERDDVGAVKNRLKALNSVK
jgi:hypothetical protein